MRGRSSLREKLLTGITQGYVQEHLDYDPETGEFTWKTPGTRRPKRVGQKAGTISHDGYINIGINGVTVGAHRLAWLYMYGKWPNDYVDHINRVRHDNRICNLRDVDQSGNMLNRKNPIPHIPIPELAPTHKKEEKFTYR